MTFLSALLLVMGGSSIGYAMLPSESMVGYVRDLKWIALGIVFLVSAQQIGG